MFKRFLSVLLALILLFGMINILPFSASAEEAEIAKEAAEPDTSDTGADADVAKTGIYQSDAVQWIKDRGNEVWWQDVDGAYGCQCVDLVMAYYQYNGYARMSGNAGDYVSGHIPSGSNWYYSSTPIPGSVFVRGYDNGYYPYGHVGLVYAVDGSTMYTVETNVVSPYDGGSNSSARYKERSVSFATTFINPVFDTPPDPTPQGHVMSEAEGAGRTIPDGDYWICSRIAQDYFLDIPGTDYNTQNGTNLQMWDMESTLASKYDVFRVKYLNNRYYQITQYNTNMAIDVESASLYRGTNIQMWDANGTNAQQWSIEKTEGGYKLRSRCNAYCMDIDGGTHSSGTNVKVWEDNGSNAQRFGLIPYSPDERPFADGVYTICSALGNTCFLDVVGTPGSFKADSNIQLYNNSDIWGNPDEKYQFEYAGNGYYRIYEYTSGLAVEIHNNGNTFLDLGQNAKLYPKNNSRGQLWKIRKNSDGTYCFINQLAGYCLDVDGGGTANGTNVEAYPYNGTNAQKWKPIRVLQDDMVTIKDVSITSDDTTVAPAVTVKVDSKTLTKDTDYTVTTNADIASGKGTVTVKGKGSYCNTVTKDIKITCTLLDKAVTVNNMVITSDVTEVNPKVTVKANSKTLKADTDYTLTSTADIANGTGTVTVTGKNGYTGTVTKNYKITIDDRNKITDSMGNQYYANQGEIVTYIINLTSPRQVNYLNGILYYNQEMLEPIITDDIGYHAPNFINGQFRILTPGQIGFDVYSNTPVRLNNTTIVKMQFRLTAKGKEGWLGHEFKTPEFTWENQGNYGLETQVLTNQELYDPTAKTPGDADGDGTVTSVDVTLIQRAVAHIKTDVDDNTLMNADVDGNGVLEIIDATWIQRYLAHMDTPYQIG